MGVVSDAPDLYLASTSPRRRALLADARIRFALCEPGPEYDVGGDEHGSEAGDPRELAAERARRKARGASPPDGRAPVLAVDTVVDLGGQELGKAADAAAAARMIERLAGREHRVHTAHCLVVPGTGALFEELATATVACRSPTVEQVRRYLDSDQWRGKAGGYGIQDSAQQFFALVSGSLDTVVGLHVPAVQRLLRRATGAP